MTAFPGNVPLNILAAKPAAPPGAMVFGALPNVYFNGFTLGLAPADVNLVAMLDGQPQIRLSMSFTTAKTLSAYLQDMIAKLEKATNHTIMKADEVEMGLKTIEPDTAKP